MFNRRNHQRTLLVLTLVTVAVAASAVYAQGRGPGRGQGGDWGGPDDDFGQGRFHQRLVERLDLTAEQAEAAAKLRDEQQEKALQMRKEMMRLRNELHGEMLKDEPSEKTALELTRKMGDLRTKMQENRLQGRLALRKLLTPEQRDKMLMMGEPGMGPRGGHRQGDGFKGRGGRGQGQGCGNGCGGGQGNGCGGNGPRGR
jgi:Spy/CpxP family protein refolding chaperone